MKPDVEKMMARNFDEKLDYSIKLVERALSEKGASKDSKAVLAFSGGIDSLSVLNLPPMLEAVKSGSVDLLFNDTRVEFPETKRFIKELATELGVKVIVAKPKITFKQIVEKYGFPIYARGRNNYQKARATVMCCHHLKKAPTKKAQKEHGWELYFTGLRAEESFNRRMSAKRYGDYFDSKTYGHTKCHPIIYWTIDDVWEFQRRYSFKYNELYDKVTYLDDGAPNGGRKYTVRTGCWCCPQAMRLGKMKWMREHFPKMFQALMLKMGLAEAILDIRINKNRNVATKKAMLMRDINYKEIFGVEKALELHPCYFDNI